MQDAFARVADHVFPRVVGVSGYVRDPEWSYEKLHAQKGDAWMAANPDVLRYPGFRPLKAGSGFLIDDGYVLSRDQLVRDVTDDALPAQILPINLIMNLFETLKVTQSSRSPWLGISVLELPLLRKRVGSRAPTVAVPRTGVYIDDVFDPSPASRVGVRPGDFLVGLSGHPVLSVADFQTWLYTLGIGAQAELEMVRESGWQHRDERCVHDHATVRVELTAT